MAHLVYPRTSHKNYLPTPAAADFLGLSPNTLARWRVEGVGPVHRKFGRKVLYGLDDLQSWADAQARTSTSDTGKAA